MTMIENPTLTDFSRPILLQFLGEGFEGDQLESLMQVAGIAQSGAPLTVRSKGRRPLINHAFFRARTEVSMQADAGHALLYWME